MRHGSMMHQDPHIFAALQRTIPGVCCFVIKGDSQYLHILDCLASQSQSPTTVYHWVHN